MVSRGGFESASYPTVEFSEYEAWTRNSHRLFTGLAFYRLAAKRLTIGTDSSAELPVARASANLFELLGVPISFEVRGMADHPTRLVLSRSAWLKYFHADAHVFGHMLQVDGQQAMIAGVVQDEDWRLPGQTDLWLLEDGRHLSTLPPTLWDMYSATPRGRYSPLGETAGAKCMLLKKRAAMTGSCASHSPNAFGSHCRSFHLRCFWPAWHCLRPRLCRSENTRPIAATSLGRQEFAAGLFCRQSSS